MNDPVKDQTIEELESEVKRKRLLKEIRDLQCEEDFNSEVALLDHKLKTAQLYKARAEAKVSERVTPLVESIKLISIGLTQRELS